MRLHALGGIWWDCSGIQIKAVLQMCATNYFGGAAHRARTGRSWVDDLCAWVWHADGCFWEVLILAHPHWLFGPERSCILLGDCNAQTLRYYCCTCNYNSQNPGLFLLDAYLLLSELLYISPWRFPSFLASLKSNSEASESPSSTPEIAIGWQRFKSHQHCINIPQCQLMKMTSFPMYSPKISTDKLGQGKVLAMGIGIASQNHQEQLAT